MENLAAHLEGAGQRCKHFPFEVKGLQIRVLEFQAQGAGIKLCGTFISSRNLRTRDLRLKDLQSPRQLPTCKEALILAAARACTEVFNLFHIIPQGLEVMLRTPTVDLSFEMPVARVICGEAPLQAEFKTRTWLFRV